jgi:hypothetical protein
VTYQYQYRKSGLAEICLCFAMPMILILMSRSRYIERSKDQVAELRKDEDVPVVPESLRMRTEL